MMPIGYLRSKVTRPILQERLVERGRLLADVDLSPGQVVLLSAPAGYGKTTLATQVLATADCTTAWVSIDSLDNDPVRFWGHVAAAIVTDSGLIEGVLARLGPQTVDAIIDELLQLVESSDSLVVLALDDLHEITNRRILESLGRITTLPPQNLTVLISTRTDPPIPLARLRAHGRLVEIRQSDLAFTVDEASSLLPPETDPRVVGDIVDTTEGWVTALKLVAMSVGPERPAAELFEEACLGPPGLTDFLAEEVLGAQPADIQRFLIETSLLDDLDAQACDAITDRPGSLAVLRRLAERQIFTEVVDPLATTFRYHPLFRDFLRRKAAELDLARFQQLHGSAARSYLARGNATAVVRHAVAAGDHALAARTIQETWLDFAQAGRISTVGRWLAAYGEDRWMTEPELRLVAAWAALNDHRFDDVVELTTDLPRSTADHVAQVHTLLSHRARHLGDLLTADREAAAAVGALSDDENSVAVAPALAASGIVAVLSGNDAEDQLTEAIRIGQAHQIDSSVVTGYSYLGLVVSSDPERAPEAEAFADHALALTDTPQRERFHQPAVAHLVKARTARGTGRVADSRICAGRALDIARQAAEPLVELLVHCELARLAHLEGDQISTRAHIRAAEQLPNGAGPHLREVLGKTRNVTRFAAAPTVHGLPGSVSLTDREWMIVRLMAGGLARGDLADQLFISENTVKTHLRAIRAKLGIAGRTDIPTRARELGLLGDEPTET